MSKGLTQLTSVRHGQVTPSQSMDLMDSASHHSNENWTTKQETDPEQRHSRQSSDVRGRRRTSFSDTYTEPEELEPPSVSRKTHICTLCGSDRKGFGTSNDLQRHQKGVHGVFNEGDRFWRCQVPGCSSSTKRWPRFDNFRQHIMKMHGDSHLDSADSMQQIYTSSDCEMTNSDTTTAQSGSRNNRVPIQADRPRAILRGEKSRSSSPSIRARPIIVGAQPYTLPKRLTEVTGVAEQESYESDSDASMTDDTMKRPATLSGSPEIFLACPYSSVKLPSHALERSKKEQSFSPCEQYRLRTITTLKQHLKRRHKKPEYYCALCYQTCATSEDRDKHVRETKCEKRECPFENKMTDETWSRVNQKKGRLQDDCEEWYRIFEIIWPNSTRPRSPYVESEASSWYSIMLEVFRASGSAAEALYAKLLENYDHPPPIPLSTRTIIQSAFAFCQTESKACKKTLDLRPPEKRRRLEADMGTSEKAEDLQLSRKPTKQMDQSSLSAFEKSGGHHEVQDQLKFAFEPQYVSAQCNSPSIHFRNGDSIANGEAIRDLRLAHDDSLRSKHRKSVSLPRTSTAKPPSSANSWQFVNFNMQRSPSRRHTAPEPQR